MSKKEESLEEKAQKALKNLKHPLFPYPKTADIVEPEVLKIKVRR